MADPQGSPAPVVKRGSEIEYTEVDAGEGMSKGVLLDESDGAPHFAMRRFVLAAGATVPEHTNEVEHEQYVLSGEYTVGLGDETYEVSAGDALLIPSGVHHWYENGSGAEASFVCVVPNGDDTIRVVDSE